jgi:hypothetical protein
MSTVWSRPAVWLLIAADGSRRGPRRAVGRGGNSGTNVRPMRRLDGCRIGPEAPFDSRHRVVDGKVNYRMKHFRTGWGPGCACTIHRGLNDCRPVGDGIVLSGNRTRGRQNSEQYSIHIYSCHLGFPAENEYEPNQSPVK